MLFTATLSSGPISPILCNPLMPFQFFLFPISNSPQIPIQDCDAEERRGKKDGNPPRVLNSAFWKGISANANSVPQNPPHKTKQYGNGRGHTILLKWWRYILWKHIYINPSSLLKAIISFLASICLIIFCVTWPMTLPLSSRLFLSLPLFPFPWHEQGGLQCRLSNSLVSGDTNLD